MSSKAKREPNKPGPKPAEVQATERALTQSTYRITSLREALQAAGVNPKDLEGDINADVNADIRLTAAEIAWLRIVAIARSGDPSLALDAAKYILDRTFGKARQQESSGGEADGKGITVVFKVRGGG